MKVTSKGFSIFKTQLKFMKINFLIINLQGLEESWFYH